MTNKFILLLQFILGGLVSFILSPLFPLTTAPLLGLIRFAPPSNQVFMMNIWLNLWLLIFIALISIVCPLLAFFRLRKHWASFSWGLFFGVLLAGFPGLLLVLGVLRFVNY